MEFVVLASDNFALKFASGIFTICAFAVVKKLKAISKKYSFFILKDLRGKCN
jgi:hypothetical protein